MTKIFSDPGADHTTFDQLIFSAAYEGYWAVIAFLARHGANLRASDPNGWTAATISALAGQVASLTTLAELGLNLEEEFLCFERQNLVVEKDLPCAPNDTLYAQSRHAVISSFRRAGVDTETLVAQLKKEFAEAEAQADLVKIRALFTQNFPYLELTLKEKTQGKGNKAKTVYALVPSVILQLDNPGQTITLSDPQARPGEAAQRTLRLSTLDDALNAERPTPEQTQPKTALTTLIKAMQTAAQESTEATLDLNKANPATQKAIADATKTLHEKMSALSLERTALPSETKRLQDAAGGWQRRLSKLDPTLIETVAQLYQALETAEQASTLQATAAGAFIAPQSPATKGKKKDQRTIPEQAQDITKEARNKLKALNKNGVLARTASNISALITDIEELSRLISDLTNLQPEAGSAAMEYLQTLKNIETDTIPPRLAALEALSTELDALLIAPAPSLPILLHSLLEAEPARPQPAADNPDGANEPRPLTDIQRLCARLNEQHEIIPFDLVEFLEQTAASGKSTVVTAKTLSTVALKGPELKTTLEERFAAMFSWLSSNPEEDGVGYAVDDLSEAQVQQLIKKHLALWLPVMQQHSNRFPKLNSSRLAKLNQEEAKAIRAKAKLPIEISVYRAKAHNDRGDWFAKGGRTPSPPSEQLQEEVKENWARLNAELEAQGLPLLDFRNSALEDELLPAYAKLLAERKNDRTNGSHGAKKEPALFPWTLVALDKSQLIDAYLTYTVLLKLMRPDADIAHEEERVRAPAVQKKKGKK
ncbi:MAG: ankyrin repeat domain-containing protein [Pseudomonadota bacterium]